MKKSEILTILSMVKPGLTNNDIIEQSTCFCFIDKRVITYNDEILISHPLQLPIEGAVPAKELYELLSKVKVDEIELNTKETELRVKGGKFKAGIAFDSEIKIPIDEIPTPKKSKWEELPENFLDAIKLSLFSASTDMTKPALTCVHIKDEFVETCDSYRGTINIIESGMNNEFLLPAGSASELCKYPVTKYQITDSWAHFMTEQDVLFSCRTFEGRYPDTKDIFNVKGTRAQFSKNILDGISVAEIFSENNIDNTKIINIILSKNKMTIKSKNKTVGWYTESFRIRYSGNDISFPINSLFLKEILKYSKEAIIAKDNSRLLFKAENFLHVVACCNSEDKGGE